MLRRIKAILTIRSCLAALEESGRISEMQRREMLRVAYCRDRFARAEVAAESQRTARVVCVLFGLIATDAVRARSRYVTAHDWETAARAAHCLAA